MRKLVLASALCAAACSDEEAPELTYHRDVAPLMADRCVGCHVEGGIAPMPLDNYESAFEERDEISVAVRGRVMPPWPPSAECNSYQHDRSMTPEQIELIARWVEIGAPEGDPKDAPPPAQADAQTIGQYDVALPMPEAYEPRINPDDYRCFLIPWTETTTKYVTGMNILPGDAHMVHHVIIYVGPPGTAADYLAMDAGEEGPGYTCFGGSGAAALPLGSWVPGSTADMFPVDTGIRIEPGSTLIMQLHYNTEEHSGEDLTTLELALADTVAKPAAILPFMDPNWGDNMPIPAGNADVKHDFSFDVTRYLGYILEDSPVQNGRPIAIHSAQLHMHTLGSKARFAIHRGGGLGETCLLDIPEWDFHWQGQYWLKEPVVMSSGDRLYIECHWDNSTRNQKVVDGAHVEPRDVSWGEGTSDEMCLGGLYITAP